MIYTCGRNKIKKINVQACSATKRVVNLVLCALSSELGKMINLDKSDNKIQVFQSLSFSS